jgi:hypothetical protein
MRLRIVIASLLFLLSAFNVSAGCGYYRCYLSETTGTCSIYFCSGSACQDPGVIYALHCYVTCNAGGCWCTPQGACYDI